MPVQMRPSAWSYGSGLDAYSGANVSAGVPQLATTHNGSAPSGWGPGASYCYTPSLRLCLVSACLTCDAHQRGALTGEASA